MTDLNFNLAEPVFLRNLTIFPIKDGSDKNLNFATIDEVLKSKKGSFSELKNPDVNKIIFDNGGGLPVLMIDGEEITGSLQNRIVARSIIARAHSQRQIPVICAEERRWEEIGGFKTGYCSYPKIRSILASAVNKKVDTQQTVWKEIERKLTVTRTRSRTSSMHEIYENLADEVERYLEGFSGLNHNTVGFIGVAGNQILGCDIFAAPEIYQKFEKKLLRSYALDAIEYQRCRGTCPDIEDFMAKITAVLKTGMSEKNLEHLRFKKAKFLGQAVLFADRPVHISVFPE